MKRDTFLQNRRMPLLLAVTVLLLLAGASYASFQQNGDNPHGNIDLECSACHGTEGWDRLLPVMQFNHNADTRFPLEGQHTSVSCRDCHTSLVFRDAGEECVDCHTDIHRNQFGTSCAQCHTPQQWDDESTFRQMHQETRFPLVGVHAGLDCQACHAEGVYRDLSDECQSCHYDTYMATTDPDHSAAGFSTDCSECHGVAPTGGAGSGDWGGNDVTFVHTSAFPLVGGHNLQDCNLCHVAGSSYANTSSECYSCHRTDFEGTVDPDHSGNAFNTMCDVCHTVQAWSPAQFDNHDATGFVLDGAHAIIACDACHASQYTGTPDQCYDCHQQDFEGVEDPNHVEAQYDFDCTMCHTTAAWLPANFDHNLTDFPLDGAHATLDCAECHVEGYNGTPLECFACHEQAFTEAEVPPHNPNSFDQDCTLCHNTEAWAPSSFNHDIQTDYPLTGEHRNVEDCTLCHINGVYDTTPTDCFDCHEEDYRNTEDPDHETQQFPFDCSLCHSTVAWDDAIFDHDQTNFPLTGAHRTVDCALCHIDGVYAGTPTACYACHQTDYEGTTDPNHVSENFPTDCSICHSTNNWEESTFDHDQTNFPLTGAHTTLDCNLCHSEGYVGTPTECYACHQSDYEGTDDPDHVAESYPTDCTLCHTTNNWDESTFDHDQTDFPLTGAHRTLDCSLCHSEGYVGTPTDCWSCHEADYRGTDDPDHEALNYPHDCTECHTTDDWDADDFDHSSTDFPLTGAHVGLDCSLCHAGGFSGTPSDCWSCHEEDYDGVSDPNHSDAGFGQVCTECHTTADWTAPLFDHGDTGWPLTGSHAGLDCNLCHSTGFTNTPTDCFFCHEDDYNSTSDPNHLSAGFPQNCESCHNTVSWDDADFDHDSQWFPIYSGTHRNEWGSCSECHPNQSNYLVFTCISCHEHNQADMDDEHDDVGGYVYDSDHCYECHPDGRAEDDRLLKQLRQDRPNER